MQKLSLVGQKVPRVDGEQKATGRLRYMTDLSFSGTLVGKLLFARYPHALIEGIDTGKAKQVQGVHCVITAKDVPGLNAYGIAVEDQPILCDLKTRYLGDPVALVVAETEDQAREAVSLIEVDYRPMETVDDPEKAMAPDAVLIHEQGNVLRHYQTSVGDPEKAFSEAHLVVENLYTTSLQDHAFLETHGGYGVPNPDGGVTVYCPGQHGHAKRRQTAKILGLPEEKVTIISSPLGGAFGGKLEICFEGLLALAALKTKRPVKLHLTREETMIMGVKRVPFKIKMRTAADRDGRFLAQEVSVICDAGPYAALSGEIMAFALENACGPYLFPNVSIAGSCVYTNNPHAASFRGFGSVQMHFAMESQVNLIAERLGLDCLAIRKMNCVKPGRRHSFGNKMHSGVGALETLEALEKSELWQNSASFKSGTTKPWIKRGVGVGLCQGGNGLGKGLPDSTAASVEITPEGKFIVASCAEELGQGCMTTVGMIAAEVFQVGMEQIELVFGDTSRAGDAGATTASRTTYLVGNAVLKAATELRTKMQEAGARILDEAPDVVVYEKGEIVSPSGEVVKLVDIARELHRSGTAAVNCQQAMPETDINFPIPLHYIQSYLAQVVWVEVNTLTGKTDVLATEVFPEAGRVINRLGLEGQVEGGTVMGLGYTLTESFRVSRGEILTKNYQTYLIPTAMDIPDVRVTPVEVPEETGPYGATGIAEATAIAVNPAVTNAIADATGLSIKDLPAHPEAVYWLLAKRGQPVTIKKLRG